MEAGCIGAYDNADYNDIGSADHNDYGATSDYHNHRAASGYNDHCVVRRSAGGTVDEISIPE